MSYNKQYNTRNSNVGGGNYNSPGQYMATGAPKHNRASQLSSQPPLPQYSPTPIAQRKPQPPPQQQAQPPLPPPPQPQLNQNLQTIQTTDVEMKPAPELSSTNSGETTPRPHWMKSKLQGVKKVTNKERRRRQNENLRRLLTPKNALMVLNEMLPNEQLTNQFKVEPAGQGQFNNQYYSQKQQASFCADLTINGNTYKGYGENKLTARNVAAEQAIRDLIIQKMKKVLDPEASMNAGAEGDEECLPMIQLASFALHKLFSEWEYEGHKVPQLKPNSTSVSEAGSEAMGGSSAGPGKPRGPQAVPKKKDLPANAATMHPCMLLTYMRPHLEYRELAVDGDRPQNMVFTLGVDVDGSTYIGKAANKKEARKLAAKAACSTIWNVRFEENPTENTPKVTA